MQIGKIPGNDLEKLILNKIKFKREDVLVHAGMGEDTAIVDLDGELLVISSDPITGASKNAGHLAVHVACNDIVTSGAEPVGIQVVLLLPETIKEEELSELMNEIEETASSINVEVLGGHTEILSAVSKTIISVTAIGKVSRENYLASSNARVGDDLVLSKGLGIEGIYILANDYSELLLETGVSEKALSHARKYKEKISVIKEGLIAAEMGANAMHDVTEGGLYGAVEEMLTSSSLGFELNYDLFPITEECKEISRALDIEAAALISSGSMLISIKDSAKLIKRLEKEGIRAACIGKVLEKGQYIIKDGKKRDFNWSRKDELWSLME
ncbi:MAG: AIR synthase family protein [bacterium]